MDSNVKIMLAIQANVSCKFQANTMKPVTENCRVFKFRSRRFEKEQESNVNLLIKRFTLSKPWRALSHWLSSAMKKGY
jgi:hypothetical protein